MSQILFFFFQAEDGIRDDLVTGVQTCALPISAFAIESPETTYSAAFVPSNIMGLNTSPNAATGVNLLPYLANYSNGFSTPLAPDLLAKVAFEPGWGHFEIKGLARFFRDRVPSTPPTHRNPYT